MNDPTKPILLDIKKVCKMTGLGKTSIYEKLKSGELPAKKIGRKTIIHASDLETFLSNLKAYQVKGGNSNA